MNKDCMCLCCNERAYVFIYNKKYDKYILLCTKHYKDGSWNKHLVDCKDAVIISEQKYDVIQKTKILK